MREVPQLSITAMDVLAQLKTFRQAAYNCLSKAHDATIWTDRCCVADKSKKQQRWLWHAIDRATGTVLAYILGSHEDTAFLELKALLEPFGITQFFTDGWGAYQRHLDERSHIIGKPNTQKIERKHLTLRTRIKRART